MIPIFDPDFTREHYRNLLTGFHGFFQPLESTLADTPGLASIVPDLPARFRTGRLRSDLRWLGLNDQEIDALPVCRTIPAIENCARALGVLYVVEGSRLGGKLISHHLQKTIGIQPESGGAFFSGNAGQTASDWQEFINILCSQASEETRVPMAAAAVDTFRSLANWLSGEEKEWKNAH